MIELLYKIEDAPFFRRLVSKGTQRQKFTSTCLLVVVPVSYSQIAVGSKRDLILVNLVTGFSMSLPALNQRRNTISHTVFQT